MPTDDFVPLGRPRPASPLSRNEQPVEVKTLRNAAPSAWPAIPAVVGKTTNLRLVLNFSPVRFDDSEINIGQLPYSDDGEELLKQLRAEHNATHVFRREGKASILAIPLAPEASLLGESRTVRL